MTGSIAGVEGQYSRAQLFDVGKPWGVKQRASEYDAIYVKLSQHAVDLGTERGRPCTVEQAAVDLAEKERICKKKREGGKSMYAFMQECEVFRREQALLRKQARLAAELAQQQQQQQDEGPGEAS